MHLKTLNIILLVHNQPLLVHNQPNHFSIYGCHSSVFSESYFLLFFIPQQCPYIPWQYKHLQNLKIDIGQANPNKGTTKQ